MLNLNQYFRNKLTGKVSRFMPEIIEAGQSLTLNKINHSSIYGPGNLFKEIELLPAMSTIPEKYKELLKVKPHSVFMPWGKFIDKAVRIMIDFLEATWSSDKMSVVYHSSGYDSRMISQFLLELKKKHGEAWLGDYKFICKKPEHKEFRQIMQYQGWPEDKYMVFREDVPRDEYYREAFDFDTNWYQVNGSGDLIVNVKYIPIKVLQEEGVLPVDGDIQLWSNQIAYILRGIYKDFKSYYEHCYLELYAKNWSVLNHTWEAIDAYFDFELLKFFLETRTTSIEYKRRDRDYIREEMIRLLDPKLLLDFHRWTWPEVYAMNYFVVSDRIAAQANKDYKNSRYGKKVNVNFSKTYSDGSHRHSADWVHYSVASFVEHLTNQGVIINGI